MERIAVGDVIHVLVDLDQEEVEEALVVQDIEPALHDAASIGAVAWSVMIKTDGPSNEDGAASEAARLLRGRQRIGGGGGRHENTFLSTLSPTRLNELKVGDQVDHRDKVGRFLSAEVKAREGTRLLMHYEGWDSKWDEWCDFSKEVGRFAAYGSISKRPTRVQGVRKGLKVRYRRIDGRWVDAVVIKVDKPIQGQVQVVYQMYGRNLTRWAHLDNTQEILAVE